MHAEEIRSDLDTIEIAEALAPQVPVVDHYEHLRAVAEEMPASTFVAPELTVGPEAVASAPAPVSVDPTPAEIRMEVTNDPRQPEAIEQPHDADTETRSGVVVPLARPPIRTETITTPYTPSEDAALMHTLRAAAAQGRGHGLRRRAIEADDARGWRHRAARERADADRVRRRTPRAGAGAAAAARRAAARAGRVAVRRPGNRTRALPDVPRSSRPRRAVPDDAAPRDLGGSARPDGGSAGALPAVRRAGARRRRARQRQVDAAERVRGSDQPDAQRSCHHDRVADRLRPREPPIVHQPARDARRRGPRGGGDPRRAPRGSRRHDGRRAEVGRSRSQPRSKPRSRGGSSSRRCRPRRRLARSSGCSSCCPPIAAPGRGCPSQPPSAA